MKKLMCMILAAILVLSMAACSEEKAEKTTTENAGNAGTPVSTEDGYYVGSQVGIEKLKASPNPLDPKTVYSSIEYDERMLYGRFLLDDKENQLENFAKEVEFVELEYSETFGGYSMEENRTTMKLSTLPTEIQVGPVSCNYAKLFRGLEEWCMLYLLNENGNEIDVFCTYEVSGNTVRFYPLGGFELERDENYQVSRFVYELGETALEYTFEFQGADLILSRGDKSVTLRGWGFSQVNNSMEVGGYLADGSPALANIDHFTVTIGRDDYDYTALYITDLQGELYAEGDYIGNAAAWLSEEGLLSLYWETEDADGNVVENMEHLVFIPGCGYSCVVCDGEKTYFYSENSLTREALALGVGMTAEEQRKLNELSESELNAVVEKKKNLLEDLAAAYEQAGLDVSINTRTGEIALDATVLFGVDESQISEAGKTFLQQFTQIYTSVVYSDTYAGFVSRVQVEGHTDTSGNYEHNMTLSQARADSVKEYCTSQECGVDAAYAELFAQSLEAIGYAYDKPVYDAQGEVDMDASRRVSFRFLISLDG